MKTIHTDVLVVGGGPTGLSAALVLERAGVRCAVVERRPGPQRAPAAHVINARTFEIWRQAGLDMERIFTLASHPRDAGAVHWVTRLGGELLGSLPFEQQDGDAFAVTPTPLRNLSQHRLEPFLHGEVARTTGLEVLFEHRWESSTQDASGVTSHVRATGGQQAGEPVEVRSRYVLAADGAGSPVRKSLGIDCIGPARIQAFVMIHFEANLRSLVREHPGVLYWICDPSCVGTFVAHDIDREWVFMHSWDPDAEPIETFDVARAEAIVRRAIESGSEPAGEPIAIRTVLPWVMTSQIADTYRDGRIFLAGDAAHRFPPTGGMGLNTGVQDAHNLAWKIAAVERGWAPPSLLDTYEAERRPVACYNAEQSLGNAMRMFEVTSAMGTAGEPAAVRASFDAMLQSAERRAEVAGVIAQQAEHFDMLGLQLGYAYSGDAILDDGSAADVVTNPVRELVPSSRPGSRLPHGWIVRDGRRLSTLDLVGLTGMTLFAAPGTGLAPETIAGDVPVHVVEWGRDVTDPDGWWTETARLGADSALLVRPDQHVAARFVLPGPLRRAEARLLAVLDELLDPGERRRGPVARCAP